MLRIIFSTILLTVCCGVGTVSSGEKHLAASRMAVKELSGELKGELVAVTYLIKTGHSAIDKEARGPGVLTTGGFRYVRHPLYLGSMLFYLGLGISTVSLVSLILLVPIFLFYNFIARYEENLLERNFGQEYKDYRKRTGRWVPKLGKAST